MMGKGHPPLAGAKIASFLGAIFLMRKISIAVIFYARDAKNCITEIFFLRRQYVFSSFAAKKGAKE